MVSPDAYDCGDGVLGEPHWADRYGMQLKDMKLKLAGKLS
jgi:hypothetical protein